MSSPATWDDRGVKSALRQYLDLRKNVDPKRELRRRAKNVGMRLIAIFKKEGVNLKDIDSKVKSLGKRVRIRPKIRAKSGTMKKGKKGAKMWTYPQMIAAELRARKSAKGFTATGWFPATEKLGGNPRRVIRNGGGPRRGSLVEKMGFTEKSETLVNSQPGAAHVAGKTKSPMQKALDAETADMANYIVRKQNEAARRNGL